MSRLHAEDGMTLVELLIVMVLGTIVLGAVLVTFEAFTRQSAESAVRASSIEQVRRATSRLSRDVRNAVAVGSGVTAAVEKATPFDLLLQSPSHTGNPTTGNPANLIRVRYCLDAATPGKLWRQTTAVAATLPSTSTCPSSAFTTSRVLAESVTNRVGATARPVWTYRFSSDTSTALTDLRAIQTTLWVDEDIARGPREAELASGITLRNANQPPIAAFTASALGNGLVALNASPSQDPESQDLTFEWYLDGATTPFATGLRAERRSLVPGSPATFRLVVTDSGGLTDERTQAVTVR
jgi:prepilin-type N-terminal cleavage/methylation domain-containing protein